MSIGNETALLEMTAEEREGVGVEGGDVVVEGERRPLGGQLVGLEAQQRADRRALGKQLFGQRLVARRERAQNELRQRASAALVEKNSVLKIDHHR